MTALRDDVERDHWWEQTQAPLDAVAEEMLRHGHRDAETIAAALAPVVEWIRDRRDWSADTVSEPDLYPLEES